MSHFRATPWVATVIAATASAGLVLGGCGGSSSPAATGGNSTSPSASSSDSTSGGGNSAPAQAGTSTAGLTGNFCADFTRVGQSLSKLPSPANGASLATDQAAAAQVLNEAAAEFNGLATEAPPNIAADIRNISSIYTTEASDLGSLGSIPDLQKKMTALTTSGPSGASFQQLITYMVTKCG